MAVLNATVTVFYVATEMVALYHFTATGKKSHCHNITFRPRNCPVDYIFFDYLCRAYDGGIWDFCPQSNFRAIRYRNRQPD
jgi:hypothetical protein